MFVFLLKKRKKWNLYSWWINIWLKAASQVECSQHLYLHINCITWPDVLNYYSLQQLTCMSIVFLHKWDLLLGSCRIIVVVTQKWHVFFYNLAVNVSHFSCALIIYANFHFLCIFVTCKFIRTFNSIRKTHRKTEIAKMLKFS